MADYQREMQRREKRERKDKRNKIIIWIIIAAVVLVLAVMKVFEINVNTIKTKLSDNGSNSSASQSVLQSNLPINIDASQNVRLENVNNRLGVITPSSFLLYDGKDYSLDYSFNHGYSAPILASCGIYSLVYDQGGKNFRLDTSSEKVYEEEIDRSILCADVSKNGNVAVASTSKTKLCDITVLNTSLEKKLELSIDDGYIIDIALNSNSGRVACAVIGSHNALPETTVVIYNHNGKEEARVKLPQGTLADIKFDSGNLWAVGDSYLGVIDNEKYSDVYKQGTISTQAFSYASSGDLIIAFGDYANSSQSSIAYVKSSGKVKNKFAAEGAVKSLSSNNSMVTVLTTDKVLSYSISSGKLKEASESSDSVNSICRLGSSIFAHKQTVIDLVKTEEVKND